MPASADPASLPAVETPFDSSFNGGTARRRTVAFRMNNPTSTALPPTAQGRAWHALRLVFAVLFCLSLAATVYFAFFARAIGPVTLPACAASTLLTAPMGWRALAALLTRRSTATMPFFRASPALLASAFALAAVYFTLVPPLHSTLGAMDMQIGQAIALQIPLALTNLLLTCVLLAVPLILLLRLLQWSGNWLRRRLAAP